MAREKLNRTETLVLLTMRDYGPFSDVQSISAKILEMVQETGADKEYADIGGIERAMENLARKGFIEKAMKN